jgi:AraC family transcriptional regulator of adaptative response / DNA-3-methyladenine glycosylase II
MERAMLSDKTCEKARLSRDHRFDGLFFTGVTSTGIYCRPICPAPPPKAKNVIYFPTAAAAVKAGLRPCLRCRPESSPGTPAWNGTSATVSRAMKLIRAGETAPPGIEELSVKLGVSARHLRRLFKTHIGASPKTIVNTQRVLFAKKLLNETTIPVSAIALASGFGSIRRFNAAFKKIYAKTPSELRLSTSEAKNTSCAQFHCRLTLAYRPPLDWEKMLDFFKARAIPGVEKVEANRYRRTVRIGDCRGRICVWHANRKNDLILEIELNDSRNLMEIVARVRQMFDLDANMNTIHASLSIDDLLKGIIEKNGGMRLPGAWDPFEVVVRAVVGQQISVKGARTILGRIAERAEMATGKLATQELNLFFPDAGEVSSTDLNGLGMPLKRIETLQRVTRAIHLGQIRLEAGRKTAKFIDELLQIKGIGPWTANYIAMRAFGEPDAFMAQDLGIIKALTPKGGARPTAIQVEKRAENWRPWRAYAVVYLWQTL